MTAAKWIFTVLHAWIHYVEEPQRYVNKHGSYNDMNSKFDVCHRLKPHTPAAPSAACI